MSELQELEVNYATVTESERFIYSVGDDGTFLMTRKSNWRETKIKPFWKRKHLHVYIGGIAKRLDRLVAIHFMSGYKPRDELIHIDGDNSNCSVLNLIPMNYTEYLKLNRIRPGLTVVADGREYASVGEFARKSYVSTNTVINYAEKGAQSRIFEGMHVEIRRA